jgi:integrase
MPARSKGPRLYLRRRKGRESVWVIRDGTTEESTGCGPGDNQAAQEALADYIARKYQPIKRESKLARIPVADVISIYLTEHAPHTKSCEWLLYTGEQIVIWWGDKTLADVRGQTCRAYAEWRCARGVSGQTARHDLTTLRAALMYYHREYGPLDAVPAVTLPRKSDPRSRWLTRSEAARLLWAARKQEHLKRFILIGLYSGTRSEAIRLLRWIPSLDAGWVDLDRGVLHRRGAGEQDTSKRRPPAKIHRRLRPFLARWQASDLSQGIAHVCHYKAGRITKLRRSWRTACNAAGLGADVTPHVLRHTCVTWLLQAGVPTWEVAGFVGMSEETVRRVYGHHSPDYQEGAANS